ncbi:acyl-coenzyme A binding domain-containing protein, putative, partial [Ixodes scapularis]
MSRRHQTYSPDPDGDKPRVLRCHSADTDLKKREDVDQLTRSGLAQEPAVANECKDAFDWVKENNLARLRECLESKSRLLDAPDDEGLTLLHWACDRGHRDVAELLLDSGADVHAQ